MTDAWFKGERAAAFKLHGLVLHVGRQIVQALFELPQHVQRVDLDLIAVVADVDAEVLPRDQLAVQAAVEYLSVERLAHIHQFSHHMATVSI